MGVAQDHAVWWQSPPGAKSQDESAPNNGPMAEAPGVGS